MWQQQGSETGMSLVPLKIVLALLILGVGVLTMAGEVMEKAI